MVSVPGFVTVRVLMIWSHHWTRSCQSSGGPGGPGSPLTISHVASSPSFHGSGVPFGNLAFSLLSAVLAAHDKNLGEAERRKVSQLADLLDKIFTFDPEKRITVTHALTHPFIKEGIAAPLP